MENDVYLYHYTSNENFFNIISTNTIRLSDCLKSNDKKEFIIIIDNILNYVTDKKIYNILKVYINEIYEEQLDEYYSIYILCFSSDGDSLPQWHMYANKAKGVCIGFKKKLLNKFIKKLKVNRKFENCDSYDEPYIEFFEVKYKNREQLENIQKESIEKISKRINEYLKINDISDERLDTYLDARNLNVDNIIINDRMKLKEFFEVLQDEKMENFNNFIKNEVRNLLYDGIKYKLSDFKYEKEWRLCINKVALSNEPKFCCINDIIKAYFEFNLKEILGYDRYNDLLEENIKIILGPKNLNSETTIKNFCLINKVDVIVSKSNINYR